MCTLRCLYNAAPNGHDDMVFPIGTCGVLDGQLRYVSRYFSVISRNIGYYTLSSSSSVTFTPHTPQPKKWGVLCNLAAKPIPRIPRIPRTFTAQAKRRIQEYNSNSFRTHRRISVRSRCTYNTLLVLYPFFHPLNINISGGMGGI